MSGQHSQNRQPQQQQQECCFSFGEGCLYVQERSSSGLEVESSSGLEVESSSGLEVESSSGLEIEPSPGLEFEFSVVQERSTFALECSTVSE